MKPVSPSHRSSCPINLAVEILGDRWTLLVLRDIIFAGHKHFRALLEGSREGISPSILSDRLQSLVENGIVERECCPNHRQRTFYRLTGAGSDLVPVMAQLGAWAARHRPGPLALCCDEASETAEPHVVSDDRTARKDSHGDATQVASA